MLRRLRTRPVPVAEVQSQLVPAAALVVVRDRDLVGAHDAPASLQEPVEHVAVLGGAVARAGAEVFVERPDCLERLAAEGEVETATERERDRWPPIGAAWRSRQQRPLRREAAAANR